MYHHDIFDQSRTAERVNDKPMNTVRILLEPLKKEVLVEFIEQQVDSGAVCLKDVRRFVALSLRETPGQQDIKPELHFQLYINSIVNHQTDGVISMLESFWQDEQYRQGFDFLMALTRMFVKDWQEPNDEYWFHRHWEDPPKEVEDYSTFVLFMDQYLAKAILMVELEEPTVSDLREEIKNLVSPADGCGGEAEDYLGDEGYRLDQTLRILDDNWTFESEDVEFLIPIYLDIYDRWGQHQDYLDLAKRFGFHKEYMLHLVKQGKIVQVMDQYLEYLSSLDDCLALIQALFEHHRTEALQIAEFALKRPVPNRYQTGDCYKWLSEHLNPDDNSEEKPFFDATDRAMQVSPELSLFKRREKHTPSELWSDIRSRYLDYCQSDISYEDIMIYAGEYDMACASLEKRGFWFNRYGQKGMCMLETLKRERSEWVKTFAKRQAEEVIALTKVDAYPGAVDILKHVKELCFSQSQSNEWQDYLQDLLTAHKRKRKLIPLLEQLA